MNAVYINYFMLAAFAVLAVAWFVQGDKSQAAYWLGAFICTASVTFH